MISKQPFSLDPYQIHELKYVPLISEAIVAFQMKKCSLTKCDSRCEECAGLGEAVYRYVEIKLNDLRNSGENLIAKSIEDYIYKCTNVDQIVDDKLWRVCYDIPSLREQNWTQ